VASPQFVAWCILDPEGDLPMRSALPTLALLALLLPGCDGGRDDTHSDSEHQVAWEAWPAETSASFTGVYASGEEVVISSGEGIWIFREGSGWSLEDDGCAGQSWTDIWGVGSGESLEYVAVGGGDVLHHVDGLTSCSDVGVNLEAVGGSSASLLFGTGWGGIYRWDGLSWTYEAVPPGAQVNDVWATVDAAYAVGEGGLILRREEKGWVAVPSPTDLALFGIGGVTSADLWAVGQDGVVLRFDGGAWTEQRFTSQTLWDVWGIQTDAVYAVGSHGAAYLWDGERWTESPTGVDNGLYAVHGSSASDVWAVGQRGMAIHTEGG
jgi:trimeric autotransporter adhesin